MHAAKQKGPLYMAAAALCWSFGGLGIRLIPWGAMSIIGMRAFLAAIVFALYRRSIKIQWTRGNILSALCLAATTMLFVFANKLTTAACAIFLQFTAPIFIILLELLLFRKKPKPSAAIAVAVTLGGMLLLLAGQMDSGGLLGNLLAIGSGLAFAGVFVSNKRPDTVPEQSLLLGFAINAVIGLPFVFFESAMDAVAWGAILVLGVVQVGLAYVFFSKGIQKTPALAACLITALEPVLNPVWVALVTTEKPGALAVAGGAVIIATVVLYNLWTQRAAVHAAKASGKRA